ncbi:MAG: hypothetical protein LC793_17855 [Thermomicrobia bacterium]|nr:hypothetical protein [Thermomicrobia bacterium]
MRTERTLLVTLMLLLSLALGVPLAAANDFADPAFALQWQAGEAIAPNFWGPLATAQEGRQEPYRDAAGGRRLVQYFDKGRMELTNGTVTNGRLAAELVTGQIQTGDVAFQSKAPPAIPIAGDPDNPGPTYLHLSTTGAILLANAPKQLGSYTLPFVSSSGEVLRGGGEPPPYAAYALYEFATHHNVSRAFYDYREKVGLPTIGLAISEPFFTTVTVAGQQKQVLVQVFERRVLTYTDSNPDAFKVEMGNIGLHYYQWRQTTDVG